MLRLERISGRYRTSALILLPDGEVIGEITVLGGTHVNAVGDVSVHLGLHLPAEVRVVRADAVHRPDGPSFDWLREREEIFNASGGYTPPAAFPAVGVLDALPDALSDALPGMPSDTLLDALPEVPNDYRCQDGNDEDDADCDDFLPDPGWGDSTSTAYQPAYQRRPPVTPPTPMAPRNLYVLRGVGDGASGRGSDGEERGR